MSVRISMRVVSAVTAGALVSLGMMPVGAAFAANTPSVGTQSGSGSTDLTMIMEDTSEHGGTAEPQYLADGVTPNPLYNPDANHDGLGDNIAFTVPTAINYVVKANGNLLTPNEGVAYIQNRGAFPLHTSSVDIDPTTGFNFVTDASASSAANSVDLQIGPAQDMLQASAYLTKTPVTNASKWNMAAAGTTNASKVLLKSTGDVSHIDKDITNQTKFGTIKWYLTPGAAS